MGATAMTSEFDMGEGQVPKEGRRGIPSLFSAASKDIYQFDRRPGSMGSVAGREEYVD